MRIGVIGTGNMGSGLGLAWARAGHEVLFGSRDPHKAAELAAAADGRAAGGRVDEAAEFGEAVLLAVRWHAVDETLRAAGPLDDRILMDCTNPMTPDFLRLVVGHTDSGAEQISARVPGARVVKVFNHIYAQIIHAGPRFGEQNVSVFYCGDDPEAKSTVKGLAADIGFEPIDAGPLQNARYLEPLAELMVQLAYVLEGGTDQALKRIRRA